jgi:hypothetical protein
MDQITYKADTISVLKAWRARSTSIGNPLLRSQLSLLPDVLQRITRLDANAIADFYSTGTGTKLMDYSHPLVAANLSGLCGIGY